MSFALTIVVNVTDPAKLNEAVRQRLAQAGQPERELNEAEALLEVAPAIEVPGCEVIEVLGIEGLME